MCSTVTAGHSAWLGTPAGVGMGFQPLKWLRAGDVVRVEVDGIGAIAIGPLVLVA